MSWQRVLPIVLLIGSNIFMTYAWYGHLKDLKHAPIYLAILLSWGVAFFEYCLQVPANRIGSSVYSLYQLKVIQEIITMSIFAVFAVTYMRQSFSWDFVAAAISLTAAAFFVFRGISGG